MHWICWRKRATNQGTDGRSCSLQRKTFWQSILPHHRHPKNPAVVVIPPQGMAVAAAAERVRYVTQEAGPCWENIRSHKDRDFSKVHIFLQYQNGGFMNLDGLAQAFGVGAF